MINTVIRSILANIYHADQSLERDVGIKVPHFRNLILCILYTVSLMLMSIILIYCSFHEEEGRQITPIVGDINVNVSILETYLAFQSNMELSMQFTFLLYLIKQRLELLNVALMQAVEEFDKSKTAWESRAVCVSVCGTLEQMGKSVTRLQVYWFITTL